MDTLERWHHESIRREAAMKFNKPPSTTEEIMALGYPSNCNIVEACGYVFSYDIKRIVAMWVAECITHDQVREPLLSRKKTKDLYYFKEDTNIDSSRRATLADYTNGDEKGKPKEKYQKGHLAAAGNHRYNFDAYCNTFSLSNIVPMFPNVNKTLADIELQAQRFAKEHGPVYIITGTFFRRKWFEKFFKMPPNYVRTGSKVQVPDAIFKLVARSIANKHYNYRVRAYLVANLPNKICKDMEETRIYLAALKRITGLDFFSEVPEHEMVEDKIILKDKWWQTMLKLFSKCILALYKNILACAKPKTDVNVHNEVDYIKLDDDDCPPRRKCRNIGL